MATNSIEMLSVPSHVSVCIYVTVIALTLGGRNSSTVSTTVPFYISFNSRHKHETWTTLKNCFLFTANLKNWTMTHGFDTEGVI